MTPAEATYLFDAAVFRMMQFPVEELIKTKGTDRVDEQMWKFCDHQSDCVEDLKACKEHLPKDHPIFQRFDQCLDSYWLANADRITKQFG